MSVKRLTYAQVVKLDNLKKHFVQSVCFLMNESMNLKNTFDDDSVVFVFASNTEKFSHQFQMRFCTICGNYVEKQSISYTPNETHIDKIVCCDTEHHKQTIIMELEKSILHMEKQIHKKKQIDSEESKRYIDFLNKQISKYQKSISEIESNSPQLYF